jgi:AcrR family transcriptional regulator
MEDPFTEPADTREAILGAAFRALCEHGYADLTIKRIGEAFEKSPSLVYHHYDGKDELLVDLLGFLLEGFEAAVSRDAFDLPPRARLDAYVAAMTDPDGVDDEHAPDGRFLAAMVELRAQAATDEAYREHFDRSDRVFRRFLERSVREAAAEERPDDGASASAPSRSTDRVDPTAVAETLQTLATGAMFRWSTTTDREWTGAVREEASRYLSRTLPAVDPEA